ncbi:DUF523 domain-containing protein [Endozoicomonadaceae bacterium StTr2]
MEKILVSSCLLGNKVRYNGKDLRCDNDILQQWLNEGRVIPFCPEVSAGLPTPRAPAEIQHGSGDNVLTHQARVIANTGDDVTAQFIAGAENTLKTCQDNQIRIAILTESSPSCGSTTIYNGQFSGTKVTGTGVTTALLMEHGIRVFSQHSILDAAALIGV